MRRAAPPRSWRELHGAVVVPHERADERDLPGVAVGVGATPLSSATFSPLYDELVRPAALAPWVATFWRLRSDRAVPLRVILDACIDLIGDDVVGSR